MSTYHRLSAISRLLASLRPAALFQDPEPTLRPPIIPDADSNGGIGWRDMFDPGSTILVMITAYPNMQVGDKIELFWDGRLVGVQLVNPYHIELGIITIGVSPTSLEAGISPVHFRTTSQPGGNVRTSHPRSVQIKIDIPGGRDIDPATPTINENLLAITSVPDPVDESNADSIVAIVPPYDNMTEFDRIELRWNGEPIRHTVQQGEIGQPIDLAVSREIIERVGAGAVLIRYEVRDVVNNWSLWSLPRVIDAEVGSDLLWAPDALDAVDGKIELDALGDQDTRVLVRAYLEKVEDDRITLTWLGNPPIGEPVKHELTHTVAAGEHGLPVYFDIPNAIAMASAGGVAAITYTVTSDRGTQRSRRTSVEIIGQVQRLAPPTLQEAAEGSVDLDLIPEAGATVVVAPYPGMASGQRLVLFAIGTAEDDPPSSFVKEMDITDSMVDNPVPFTVPKAFFRPLVNGSLCAYYRVQGEESDRLQVNVIDQNGAQLPAPSVAGVVDDALDPDAVPNGTNATVPQYLDKALGDRITLFWHGVKTLNDTILVTEDNLDSPINFPIPYDPYIIGNLNSDVTVRYWVKPDNGDLARSVVLNLPIRRKAPDNFVAPTVLEAVGATLDPYNALNGATVRVAYEGMLTTDKIGVAWINPATSQPYIDQQDGSASGEVHFDIPVSVVAASQGQTIEVVYAVVRGGNPGVPSESLYLQVSELEQRYLPPPVVPEADASDTLDLAAFEGDASVTVAAWPLIALGQRYWIKVSGTLNSSMPHSFYVARNRVPTASEVEAGLDKPMLRTELENLKDSTALTVEMKVAFDGVGNESSAIAFPVKTYTVKSLEIVTPIISSVVDDKDRTIPNNGATTATTVKLTGTASIRRQVEIFNSGTSLGTAMSDDTGVWNKTVTDLTRGGHSFTAIGRYGGGDDDPESDPFAITVVDVVTPAITRVSENNRGISNGGVTTATSVLLRGTASVRQLVEIYEGSTWLETVRSDDSGTWYKTVSDLAKGGHSFTAIGLYDDDPKSDAFAITVVDVVNPVISSVVDDKGVEIPNNGSTMATTVKLTGTASIRQQVQILNSGTPLRTVRSDDTGVWIWEVTGLSTATHSFTAKGIYGVEPESDPFAITVLEVVKPTISSVLNDNGVDIPKDGLTTATTVTLIGTALSNMEVQIYNGRTLLETAMSDGTGAWRQEVTGLSTATHSFTAKGIYGSNPESEPFAITVVEAVRPTISSIVDDEGVDIPRNGRTTSTSVKLTGTGSINLEVVIYNGATSLGRVTSNDLGVWEKEVTDLVSATHSFTALANYRGRPRSEAYVITVGDAVKPTINSVRDNRGVEIPEGGSTISTLVTLRGTASPSQRVEILHFSTLLEIVDSDATGVWTKVVTGLSVNAHRFTARMYGTNLVSDPRHLTVIQPLQIDRSTMTLAGLSIKNPSWFKNGQDSVGNTETRVATGGTPPYRYTSNSSVVSVTTGGKVTGEANGTATITVTDAAQNTVQYQVIVSNVYSLLIRTGGMTATQHATWINNTPGVSPVNGAAVSDILRVYSPPFDPRPRAAFWTGSSDGCGSGFRKMSQTGFLCDTNWNQAWDGIYLVDKYT
jgi:hypothetical protein